MADSELGRDTNLQPIFDFQRRANVILRALLNVNNQRAVLSEAKEAGGYYSMFDGIVGVCHAVFSLGEAPEHPHKCFVWANEKNVRLYRHPDHFRSWESRNPDNGEYGGAIRGQLYLHSFSGLPEDLDEVFSTLMAVFLNDMSFERAAQILGPERTALYIPIVSLRRKIRHL